MKSKQNHVTDASLDKPKKAVSTLSAAQVFQSNKINPSSALFKAQEKEKSPANAIKYHALESVEQVRYLEAKVYAERADRLKKIWQSMKKDAPFESTGSRESWNVTRKDLSERPAVFHMVLSKRVENSYHDSTKTSVAYISDMLKIGQKRGFEVHVHCSSDRTPDEIKSLLPRANNLRVISAPYIIDGPWAEDNGAITPSGMTIPAPLFLDNLVDEQKYEDRLTEFRKQTTIKAISRFHPTTEKYSAEDVANLQKQFEKQVVTSFGGNVSSYDTTERLNKIALALSSDRKVHADFTHFEGGNVINGNSYALVGRNGVEFSRAILEQQLTEIEGTDVTLSDDRMRQFIAADLGISDYHNVIFVEQPEFHLDMSIILLNNGKIILNDALMAVELEYKLALDQCTTAEEKSDVETKYNENIMDAREKKRREDRAMADIQAQHPEIQIIRAAIDIPGRILSKSILNPAPINFANGEGGVDITGKQFFITNGGLKPAEEHFSHLMKQLNIEVEFINADQSCKSLGYEYGGLGCRAKCEAYNPAAILLEEKQSKSLKL